MSNWLNGTLPPIPELARQEPTGAIVFQSPRGSVATTVAALLDELRQRNAALEDADLVRLAELGEISRRELEARGWGKHER